MTSACPRDLCHSIEAFAEGVTPTGGQRGVTWAMVRLRPHADPFAAYRRGWLPTTPNSWLPKYLRTKVVK